MAIPMMAIILWAQLAKDILSLPQRPVTLLRYLNIDVIACWFMNIGLAPKMAAYVMYGVISGTGLVIHVFIVLL